MKNKELEENNARNNNDENVSEKEEESPLKKRSNIFLFSNNQNRNLQQIDELQTDLIISKRKWMKWRKNFKYFFIILYLYMFTIFKNIQINRNFGRILIVFQNIITYH